MAKSKTFSVRKLVKRGLGRGVDLLRSGTTEPNAPRPSEAHVIIRDTKGDVIAERTVTTGASLLAITAKLGVDLDHYCGGQCSCGTCRIKVNSGAKHLSKSEGMEGMVLGGANEAAGDRLACQARVLGDVDVTVPRWF